MIFPLSSLSKIGTLSELAVKRADFFNTIGRKQTIANGSNRPKSVIQGRWRERRLSDL
jgi:hypothetical protein